MGFERTTIRAVAAAAEIDPSMVMRYYGSKEGLFAAAVTFDLRLPDLAAVPQHLIGRRLAAHFIGLWEEADVGASLALLLRTAVTHPEAGRRVEAVLQEQVAPAIARVAGPARARRCAALVATQLIGLGYTRYVLKLEPVARLPRSVIVDRVGATLQSYLDYGSGAG